MSMPIVPASAPMAAITAFLAGSEPPMVETATRQNRMRAKYSAGPKAMATSTITGVSQDSTRMPMLPPMKDATVVMKRATEARPCFAMGRSEEHTYELQSLMRKSYAV